MGTHLLNRLKIFILISTVSFLFTECSNISEFSQYAYQQAVNLKVESLNLISYASEPFEEHSEEVSALKLELSKAVEFSRGRPDNEISTRQWEILIDDNRNLLGGVLKKWEEENTLSPVFIEEISMIISDAFDTIIGLESGKIKPSEIQ